MIERQTSLMSPKVSLADEDYHTLVETTSNRKDTDA